MMLRLCRGALKVRLSDDMKDCMLHVGSESIGPTTVRRLKDVADVMYTVDQEEGERPLYYVFRGVNVVKGLSDVMEEHGIRHDVTVILPGRVGTENVRTHGHYHPTSERRGYGEVYQVYYGEAVFILQERRGKGRVGDVVVAYARSGDSIYIPPTYGHVTYNWGDKPLVLGNLVFSGFRSEYSEYKELGGPSYYLLSDGRLVPNTRYQASGSLHLMPRHVRFRARGFIFRDVVRRASVYAKILLVDLAG